MISSRVFTIFSLVAVTVMPLIADNRKKDGKLYLKSIVNGAGERFGIWSYGSKWTDGSLRKPSTGHLDLTYPQDSEKLLSFVNNFNGSANQLKFLRKFTLAWFEYGQDKMRRKAESKEDEKRISAVLTNEPNKENKEQLDSTLKRIAAKLNE